MSNDERIQTGRFGLFIVLYLCWLGSGERLPLRGGDNYVTQRQVIVERNVHVDDLMSGTEFLEKNYM
jgi:hypothetical protein